MASAGGHPLQDVLLAAAAAAATGITAGVLVHIHVVVIKIAVAIGPLRRTDLALLIVA
jgi:hypothetical protein